MGSTITLYLENGLWYSLVEKIDQLAQTTRSPTHNVNQGPQVKIKIKFLKERTS